MKLLLLAPHFPPETVAGAARMQSFARDLAALGHEVRVIAPRVARGRGRLANLAHQLALRRAFLREGRALDFAPDAVIVSSPPPIAALAGIPLAKERGAKLVVDVRDSWPDVLVEAGAMSHASPVAALLRVVTSRLLSAAALVTTPTETKVARLRERTHAPVALVVNGVDDDWLRDAPMREPSALEILYAGNVGRAQDVALLPRALALTTAPWRATIVGDGELAHEIAPSDRVALHAPESRDAVRQRLARCTCAFVSLRSAELVDAVPSKLLEAMALGVPVVAAVAGEAERIVRESRGGFVVAPGDAAGLARTLDGVARLSPDDLSAMGERGRAFVLARFRRESAAAELSRALSAIAAH